MAALAVIKLLVSFLLFILVCTLCACWGVVYVFMRPFPADFVLLLVNNVQWNGDHFVVAMVHLSGLRNHCFLIFLAIRRKIVL